MRGLGVLHRLGGLTGFWGGQGDLCWRFGKESLSGTAYRIPVTEILPIYVGISGVGRIAQSRDPAFGIFQFCAVRAGEGGKMERIEKTVFISYRRTNFSWAMALWQNLTHHGYDVFIDYEGIGSGDFESIIVQNILARAHFLIVLTPSALERCAQPGDLMRREIETALDNKRNIVPLMLEDFNFGAPAIADQLTGTLAAIKRYNGLSVPNAHFLRAMDTLRDVFLNKPLAAVIHPSSAFAQLAATTQSTAAEAAPPVQENELTAQQYFERGLASSDPDEQIRFYSEAIRLKPDYADAYNNRGVVKKKRVDLSGAIQDYNEAIRLAPNDADLYCNRANARFFYGDIAEAMEDYRMAIVLKPDQADFYVNRGAVRCEKGEIEGALEDCDQAIRLRVNFPEAYNNRGNVLKAKADLDGALNDYNEALRLNPDYFVAYNNRGNTRRAKGDLDGAFSDYNEALRLSPDYPEAYNGRGNTRRAKGDLNGALADFTESLRLRPEYLDVYGNRGDLFRQMDQDAAAITDLRQYLDLGGGVRDRNVEMVEGWIRELQKKLEMKAPKA